MLATYPGTYAAPDADEDTNDQLGGHTAKLLTGYDVEHVAEQALNIK